MFIVHTPCSKKDLTNSMWEYFENLMVHPNSFSTLPTDAETVMQYKN